jgi:hypothetical protein
MKNLRKKLSYTLYILLVLFLFTACESGANGDKIPLGNRTIQTIEYDECEYIYLRRYGSVAIIHKGNCKHCEKRNK